VIAPRTSVLEAVSAAIAQDATLAGSLPGGVWTGEIPEGRAMPYASLEVDTTAWDFTSGGADLEKTTFSVVAFATGAEVLDNLLDRLQTFLNDFDYAASFANNDWLAFLLPARRTTRSEFARDPNGNQVFTGVVMFEAGVFRH
jgi:hypothetical protein